jgi:hypothetical protein
VKEVVLYGSVQSVQQGEEGMKIEASVGTIFEAVWDFFVVGPYRTVRTTDCLAWISRCSFFWVGRTTVQTWHIFEAEIFGTVLGVVSGFSLGWKLCYCC